MTLIIADAPLLIPEESKSDARAVIERVAALRSGPDGPARWKDVEFDVLLSSRTLTRYVWVLAAVLRGRGLTWEEIAGHAWVEGKLTGTTLRNKHKRRKLPTGQTFGEFVTWYQAEMHRQYEQLMQEAARSDSLTVRGMVNELLKDCNVSAKKLRAGQQDLDLDGELSKKKLFREAVRIRARKELVSQVKDLHGIQRLTTASPTEIIATPDEAVESSRVTDRDELLEKIRKRRKELEQLPQAKQGVPA